MSSITVVMPLKDQKAAFLKEALSSVIRQTSPRWTLLVVTDPATPPATRALVSEVGDPRVHVVESAPGFAVALNTGMRAAQTPFVSILLSDDRLAPEAIETLERALADHPDVDFFHSSRRYIDADGRFQGPIMESIDKIRARYFARVGSPVKHLLCWRRSKALEIGGFDESLSAHGCDDYDFPWRMLEGGARFQAIKECLYHYRIHHAFERLTTDVPIEAQTRILSRILEKHQVPTRAARRFVKKAARRDLRTDKSLDFAPDAGTTTIRFWEMSSLRADEFFAKGIPRRYFFAHRVHVLPRCGPDAFYLAKRMCGVRDPRRVRQIHLYANPSDLDGFPDELFFSRDVMWHQQHFGLKGLVGSASLVFDAGRASMVHCYSDLVQRISRRREHKTQIEKRFKGWNRMLFNAALDHASRRGARELRSPSADFVLRHADRLRSPERELYERVYDRTPNEHYAVERRGDWWRIDLARNRDRIIELAPRREARPTAKTIVLCHDIERELGHVDCEPEFARSLNGACDAVLSRMLEIEREMGLKATYNVVGQILGEVRDRIETDGHDLAFHSFDHRLPPAWRSPLDAARWWIQALRGALDDGYSSQLSRCYELDIRIKGYRPPQSRLTPDVNDRALNHYGFEWLASGARSLGVLAPRLQNGIVKIPILFDDFDLHRRRMSFEEWEAQAMETIRLHPFVAFSLHDCYAAHWLPHYRSFLEKIRPLGRFRTMAEVSADVILSSGQ